MSNGHFELAPKILENAVSERSADRSYPSGQVVAPGYCLNTTVVREG